MLFPTSTIINTTKVKYLLCSHPFVSLLKLPIGRIIGIKGMNIFQALDTYCQFAHQESCMFPTAKKAIVHSPAQTACYEI